MLCSTFGILVYASSLVLFGFSDVDVLLAFVIVNDSL